MRSSIDDVGHNSNIALYCASEGMMFQEAFEAMIERSLIGEVGTVLLVLGLFMVILGIGASLEGFFKDMTRRR